MKRIIGIGLLFLGTLISVGCGVEQEAYDSLNQLLIESVAEDGPGVVLYANGPRIGEQVFARGTVDRERDNNARTINHFRIGGITKAFMSTLVLQMVTEGNLTLEDTLAAHLPGEIADNIPNSNQITIRQMLNMTSGI
ncbi:MAG: serine hydrolase, partial [Chloroflexi bacterium]|nr:serine hydrolase [Chloroflexota bacterium]